MNANETRTFHLSRRHDQVVFQYDKEDVEIPVRILLVAPLSDGKRIVSILHQEKKEELILIKSLETIDGTNKKIIEEEIERCYFFPKITKINDVSIHLGDYYWDVVTDKGGKKFLLSSPSVNMRWVSTQRIILCDSDGIKYDLCDMEDMDQASRDLLQRII